MGQSCGTDRMADAAPKKRSFRKFQYRGIELEALLDLKPVELTKLFPARIRRRFSRGLPKKYSVLLKKLRKAKKECPMHEKPEVVKTHLRNMIIMPEMIGSVVGVYNGKSYVSVEIKAEMVGTYLAEYSMTYRPLKQARARGTLTRGSSFWGCCGPTYVAFGFTKD